MHKNALFLLIKRIFLKKITIYKWQLNLTVTIAMLGGIIFGGYVGIINILKISAANDTTKVWTFDLAHASEFTYNSTDLEVSNSGIAPKNRISNGTFDTNLSGWSGVQAYALNDEFTTDPTQTLISDAFNRTDGAIGNADTGGAWGDNNNTWAISANSVSNATFLEGELTTNPGMELDSGWSAQGTPTINERSIEQVHSGTYSRKIVTDASSEGISGNCFNLTLGKWYMLSSWIYISSGSAVSIVEGGGRLTGVTYPSTSTIGSWVKLNLSGRSSGSSNSCIRPLSSGVSTFYADDASYRPLTLASLFTAINASASDVQAQAKVTTTASTQAGLVLNLDSISDPRNFRLVYTDGTNIYIDDVVNGVYTNKQATAHGSGTLAYVPGKVLSVVDKGISLTVTYGGVAVGSTQTMTANTNTKHGLFSTYGGNTFDDVSVRTLLNGTLATDGTNARTVIDTRNRLSISGGLLNSANGGSNWGDPGMWYPSVARSAGRMVVANAIAGPGSSLEIGFSTVQNGASDPGNSIYLEGGGGILYPYNNNSGVSAGTFTSGTSYTFATVLRSSGAYYFVKGGTYTNWTMLWSDSRVSVTPMYPAIIGYQTSQTHDFMRMPSSTWLPTPLVYDSFTRNDGGIGSSEVGSPDGVAGYYAPSLAWTGGSISGNKLVITPTTGSEMYDTGASTFDSGIYHWSTYPSNLLENDAGSLKSTYVSNYNGAVEYLRDSNDLTSDLTIGSWYNIGVDSKVNAGSSINTQIDGTSVPSAYIVSGRNTTNYTRYNMTFRATGTTGAYFQIQDFSAGEVNWIDNISLKPLTLSSLFSTVDANDTSVVVSTDIVMTAGTQAGLVLGLDSASTPTKFLIAYHDGGKVRVEQLLNGTYSTIVTAANGAYTSGGTLTVTKDGTAIRLYYNNALIGTGTCSASITGTRYGLFSTYSGNTFDNFSVFPRGTGTTKYTSGIFDDLTTSQDTGIKYSGAGSAKLIATGNDANFLQSINVGDTATYSLSALAYKGAGQAVTTNDINLYYNTGTITTSFESIGGDWYKISGTFAGIASAKDIGFRVKAGVTVYIDNVSLVKTGNLQVYTTNAYTNANVNTWDSFADTVTTPGTSVVKYQLCSDDGSACESGGTWEYYNGSAWVSATNTSSDTNTLAQLTTPVLQTLPVTSRKISVKAILQYSDSYPPTLTNMTLGLTTDIVPPDVNASSIIMHRTASGTAVALDGWTKESTPKFDWTAGADAANGTGIQGYCLYLGPNQNGNPVGDKGLLGTSPIDTTGKPCPFIISTNSIDFATASYRGGTWLTSSSSPYYLNIKAIDNVNLPYGGSSATFSFYFDNTAPSVNASTIIMKKSTNGATIASNGWTNGSAPKFDWTAGTDTSGLQGYCVYLGLNANGDPASDKGFLGTSPIDTTGKGCQFIISTNSVDFSDVSLRGNPWLTSNASPYYINIKAINNSDIVYTGASETFHFRFSNTPPSTNASNIIMKRTTGGTTVDLEAWTKDEAPEFDWTEANNAVGGLGIQGYCLYIGHEINADPTTDKGLLGTSPIDTADKPCQFIIGTPNIDFSITSYRGNPWLTSSNDLYYIKIKAIDNGDSPYEGDSATFSFKFDNTPPTNVSYISCSGGNFGNVVDMNFAWPTTGASMSSDDTSQVLGWQYQLNSTEDTWQGTSVEDPNILGVGNYIPMTESSIHLDPTQDGTFIHSGNNIVYFRTVDNAGKPSTDASIRTCSLSFGGQAPTFGGSDKVTVTPDTKADNNFALSWPEATPTTNQHVTHYYYMLNTTPPSTLNTLQSNVSAYIDNGTSTAVTTRDLPNVNKGTNTVYVVSIDDSTPPNYSPSNYISGTFTLNSTDPDNVGDLVASDSSIKSKSQWNVTLTWTEPVYQGAGNLSYKVYRSDDGITFTQVGTASGLSYVDNVPSSETYYYKVITKDGANALSSGTNPVSILPTGKWTVPPTLETIPVVTNITTKKAVVSWSTGRTSDSKISYGTKSSTYEVVEPSSSDQVTAHSIQLIGLNANTTYFFKAKWTDEDGNTGVSEEYSFKTQPAPVAKNVNVSNVGLSSGLVNYSVKGSSKVKIYYGKTTSFGGVLEVPTATIETTYTSVLSSLEDGTKYYFKINMFDNEGYEYEGEIHDFTTLPRPRISNVQIQQVANTAQSTLQVSWDSNTNISSIVTYYPEGKVGDSKDEVSVQLIKGEHKLVLRGLLPETSYYLIVKGRDKVGNEAVSGIQKVTTATDTRPPVLTSLAVEGSVVPKTVSTAQETYAQLVVSWTTDEPATSQVEYGEGSGSTYSQKTQLDANLTYNHIVIISGLTPSKVYHLRGISRDKASNESTSVDTVTITPKSVDNALNLVIANLQDIFGFVMR